MKFTVAAVAALAAGAQASYAASNVTYVTEVVTAYTTYCPAATELTYGGKTYTVSEVSFFSRIAPGLPSLEARRLVPTRKSISC